MGKAMSTKNMGRTALEGGHCKSANVKFRLHRRRERALAKAYCRDPQNSEEYTIPHARRLKHQLYWDDIHSHYWRKILSPFFLAHMNRPIDEALSKLMRRHHSNSYKDRMILKEARGFAEFASMFDGYDFAVDENGIIRAPEDCVWIELARF